MTPMAEAMMPGEYDPLYADVVERVTSAITMGGEVAIAHTPQLSASHEHYDPASPDMTRKETTARETLIKKKMGFEFDAAGAWYWYVWENEWGVQVIADDKISWAPSPWGFLHGYRAAEAQTVRVPRTTTYDA